MKMRPAESIYILILGVCCVYSAACRLFGFLSLSRANMVIALGILFLVGVLLAWLFTRIWLFVRRRWGPWVKKSSLLRWLLPMLGAALITGVVFTILPYHWPTFPGNHELELITVDKTNPLSKGDEIGVLEIKTISLLDNPGRVLETPELIMSGHWKHKDGMWLVSGSESAGITYQGLVRAGITVLLRTTPHSGMIDLAWDEHVQRIDLYSKAEGTRRVRLLSSLSWNNLGRIRKLFAGGLIFADSFSAFSLLFFAFVATAISHKRILAIWAIFSAWGIRFLSFWRKNVILLVVLAGVAGNLLWFYPFVRTIVYPLKSTEFTDIIRQFKVKRSRPQFALLGQILDSYHDSALIASPDLLSRDQLSKWQLETFGAVKMVIVGNGNDGLSEEQEVLLSQETYVTLEKGGNSNTNYFFVSSSYTPGDPVCMMHGRKGIYLFSAFLVPGCEDQ